MHSVVAILICLFTFEVESTDIAAVYKHGIILLKNADQISSELPREAESLKVELPHDLLYPTSLAYEPFTRKFFVSDANDENTAIFSLSIKDKNVTMESLVSKESESVVDAITYDPSNRQLLWTDSEKNGIYIASISKSDDTVPNLIINRDVNQPRGITVDYCHGMLYWTEREEQTPTIEMYDMEKKSVEAFKEAEQNIYYQAIDYNSFNQELIWAETLGDDESNSSCKIVVRSLESGEEVVLSSFENCYPFSLTSDRDHVYWSDWSKHGIMRVSRKDPVNSLVKLVKTPYVLSNQGGHNGAFGIVNLQKISLEKNFCSKDMVHLTHPKVPSSDYSLNDELQLPRDVTTDTQVFTGTKDQLREETVQFTSVKSSASTLKTGTIYRHLRLVIIILALTCLFFMTTTIILCIRSLVLEQRCFGMFKGLFVTLPVATVSTSPKKSKAHRRFGTKSKSLDGQLCPRSADDGIKIDIEDCCQMTLCDTPCYTSVKKEGKGYKNSKSQAKYGDKEELLNDLENV